MRRDQTAAIARAVGRLVEDPRLWRVDAGALAFDGLDRIPHGFEHPAEYQFEMMLWPGDVPPLALDLAGALGMASPSLGPTDWPELRQVVDAEWAARHPGARVALAIKIDADRDPGAGLGHSDELWGPIRVERLDVAAEDDEEARASILQAIDEVAAAVAETGSLELPSLRPPWGEVEMSPDQLPWMRIRRRWVATRPFLRELERRGAVHLQSAPSFFKEFYRHRNIVVLVQGQVWGDAEWLRSVTLALP